MKNDSIKNDTIKKYINIAAVVLCTIIVGCFVFLLLFYTEYLIGGLKRLLSILQPFIYGAVIAYLLRPLCRFFEKLLTRLQNRISSRPHPGLIRMCAIFLAFLLAALVILLLLFAVIPQLVTSISGIIALLPGVVADFQAWIKNLEYGDFSHEMVTFIDQVITTLSERLQKYLANDLLPNMQAVITGMTSSFLTLIDVVKNFGIGCIVAVYFLSGKEKFISQAKLVLYSLFSQKWADRILHEVHYTDRMFSSFITGKLLDSTIIGVICFLFAWIAKLPYAMLVSIIVGVTNMIPFFGPYLGAVPSALLILMVSPSKCVVFLIFIIILQQVDGNIIGPHILGDKMGVSGFWVLFSILFFGSLWGLPGMLVGVPVFAVIYDLLRKFIFLGLNRRNKQKMIDDYHQRFPQ